ncbi:SRPBCC family protein [Cryobacterium lactosi]|uniref:SRPBCC family protein n=1 Tax=Cryobacterium lactosi TaxID=1259202 RepID=UPI00141A9B65|nr:SRPBCC family protein [Cryobacterium lactosi]
MTARTYIPASDAMAGVRSVDPALTFTGFGPLPAVEATSHGGPWDRTGDVRTLTFSDGTTARETITSTGAPAHYSYRLDGLSNVLGRLVHHAESSWRFIPETEGSRWEWTFTFATKRYRTTLLRVAILPLWTRYMTRILARTVREVKTRFNV